jgi:acetyl-CoA decarbonylase/synthase complex subunit gamma
MPAGPVAKVATQLTGADRLGTVKARIGVGRMHYAVPPGLYAVGAPDAESPVFVSANYKMSFDCLRSALDGLDGWIMVLDTKGINVWCAAGKGTFGTDEICARIEATGLPEVVSHRELILPQLGAPGVAAHEVNGRSGFRVVYGPVRAEDIPAFLSAGRQATPEMRRVRFGLKDRLVLVPMELIPGFKYVLLLAALMALAGGFGPSGYSLDAVVAALGPAGLFCGIGLLGGAVLTPALLPWVPGRAFSAKGALIGIAAGAVALLLGGGPASALGSAGCLLVAAALSSFLGMNFTGASTYTSLSGVEKEMRLALPLQGAALILGVIAWTASGFMG